MAEEKGVLLGYLVDDKRSLTEEAIRSLVEEATKTARAIYNSDHYSGGCYIVLATGPGLSGPYFEGSSTAKLKLGRFSQWSYSYLRPGEIHLTFLCGCPDIDRFLFRFP